MTDARVGERGSRTAAAGGHARDGARAAPVPAPAHRGRRLPALDGPRGWAIGLGATGLLLGAFPPFSLWPLAVPAVALLAAFAADAPRPRAAFARLAVCGLLYFALGSAWITYTMWLNLVPITVVGAFWFGALGWGLRRVLAVRGAWPALPLLWVASETCRLYFPLSGYPWQFVGHAGAASDVLVQVADLGGVLAVTFVLASAAAGLLGWLRGGPHARADVRAALLVLALAVAYGLLRPHTLGPPAPGPRLVAVQPNFPAQLNAPATSARVVVDRLLAMTGEALDADPPPRLVLWPETVWPGPLDAGVDASPERAWPRAEERALVRDALRVDRGSSTTRLLSGALTVRGAEAALDYANSAVYWDEAGERLALYDKAMLVPGGETLPYGDLLPERARATLAAWVERTAGFSADLRPGPGPDVMDLDGMPFGVTICYENAYGDYVRRSARLGARFLVNLSNEAWFGTSTEFDHMALQSRLRAVETRRALFRATNSGVSTLVLPDGRARERLVVDGRDRAVAGLFAATVPLHDDRSLYVMWGDAPAWACLVLGAALALRPRGVFRRSVRLP